LGGLGRLCYRKQAKNDGERADANGTQSNSFFALFQPSNKNSMYTFIKKVRFVAFLAVLSVGIFACSKDETPAARDIVDVALADSRFSTLTRLLTDNGLVPTLRGTGPFTVFAPTNEAFARANLAGLTNAEIVQALRTHVISGNVKAADVRSGAANTLGAPIYLSKNGNEVAIKGNIRVTTADIPASNGVIHVISDVIVPPTRNLVQVAQSSSDFSELVSLVLAADPAVLTALSTASANGLTVFAPTNRAFEELYRTTPKATLLLPANRGLLTNVLLYHVVAGRVFSTDLPSVSGEVRTQNPNGTITFDLAGGTRVRGRASGASNITAANLVATNGVIHVIDKVLMP
jgi:uncharacterized surface protein with fasciclin (FAS1) repeats